MFTQAPKGTKDILPSEIHKWHYVEGVMQKIFDSFGYREIRIPVFEHTELFLRGVGETTDIVQKEMYTFNDKGGRSITLRPEGTAGVVRSYIEHGMASMPQPVKMYYNITAYRYENVQKGRYREFHQFGAEVFGSAGFLVDVEVVSLLWMFFNRLGITDLELHINSNGCPECRSKYHAILKDFLGGKLDSFCSTCRDRFEKNPLRMLDCKEEKCRESLQGVPALIDNICVGCREHFDGFKAGLDNLGISYKVNMNIVRGLDYYTRTVFEFISNNIGSQGTVCGGGRYDGLMETCGGTSTPGIGFGAGIERILSAMEARGIEIPQPDGFEIYVASIGEKAKKYAQRLVYKLRAAGRNAEVDLMDRSVKAQMKYADKLGAKYSIVLGDDEIDRNSVSLKNMKTGEQHIVSLDRFVEEYILRTAKITAV